MNSFKLLIIMIKVTFKYSCMNILLEINANFVVVWSLVIRIFSFNRHFSIPFQSAPSTYLSVRNLGKLGSSTSLICTGSTSINILLPILVYVQYACSARRYQKRVSNHLDLGLWMVVNYQGLGIELGLSGKATHTLKCCFISLAPGFSF